MKTTTLVKAVLACFMLGSSVGAYAATTTIHDAGHSSNLEVKGFIVPVACNITWPGSQGAGGVANFRDVKPVWATDPDKETPIGQQPVQMEINCVDKTTIALSYI